MPYAANYPTTVTEVLDDSMTFKPAALAAIRVLRRSKPWRGNSKQRKQKLRTCLNALAAAYNIPTPGLVIGSMRPDCYSPVENAIYLSDRMSVVTFLHEFAHARGFDERQACRWSINLFRRVFPRSYASCRHVRHTLIRSV